MSTHNLMHPLIMDDINPPRMVGFTPGPWKLASEEGAGFVYALNERGVNRFWLNVSPGNLDDKSRTPDAECMANARLIAAAPELLSRLQWTVQQLDAVGKMVDFTLGMVRSLNDCRAVIAKATMQEQSGESGITTNTGVKP